MNTSLKRILVFLIAAFVLTTGFSQVQKLQHNPSYDKKWFHLGFTLGLNTLTYKLVPSTRLLVTDSIYTMEVDNYPGFHLGVITDLRLFEYLNLRCQPGMLFGERSITYMVNSKGKHPIDPTFESSLEEYVMRMPTIYLDLPLLLKFKGKRVNNYRPYLIAGGSIKYDLETIRTEDDNDGYTLKVKPFDYYWEAGIGVDFYMVFFKLSTELKLCNGFSNIVLHENTDYSMVIEKLKSRAIMFSLHFE